MNACAGGDACAATKTQMQQRSQTQSCVHRLVCPSPNRSDTTWFCMQVYRLAPTNMEALRYLAQLSQVCVHLPVEGSHLGSCVGCNAAGQTNSLGIRAPGQEHAAPPQALMAAASCMRHRSLVCKKTPPSLAQKWLGWSGCRQLPSRHLRLPLLGASLRSGHPPAAGGLAHRPPCLLRQLLHRQHSSSSAGQRACMLPHVQLCGRPHEVPKMPTCWFVNDYLYIVAQQDSGWSKCAECSSRASKGQNEQTHARGKL